MLKICKNTLEECKKLADNINCSRCDVIKVERLANLLSYRKKEKKHR